LLDLAAVFLVLPSCKNSPNLSTYSCCSSFPCQAQLRKFRLPWHLLCRATTTTTIMSSYLSHCSFAFLSPVLRMCSKATYTCAIIFFVTKKHTHPCGRSLSGRLTTATMFTNHSVFACQTTRLLAAHHDIKQLATVTDVFQNLYDPALSSLPEKLVETLKLISTLITKLSLPVYCSYTSSVLSHC